MKGSSRGDGFYRLAKASGFRARSAFKLLEILDRFRLLKPGDAVIDLGCAPGSFLQVLSEQVGPGGRVVGLDRVAVQPVGPQVLTLVRDIFAAGVAEEIAALLGRPADLLASDLAPRTTGIRERDARQSIELARVALDLAHRLVRPGGAFVAKVFMSPEVAPWVAEAETKFRHARLLRPEATRARSRETFLVATDHLAG